MWTRAIHSALVGMPLVLSAAVEAAPLVNGGFETGDLTGWGVGGVSSYPPPGAAVVGSLAVPSVSPTQGSYMAMVSNGGWAQDPPGPFVAPVNYGLPPGAINGGTAGLVPIQQPDLLCSSINCDAYNFEELWQTFSVSGSRMLTFDWRFLSNENLNPIYWDWALVSINGHLAQLLAATDACCSAPYLPAADQAMGQYASGGFWNTSQFVLPSAGDYTLTFVVAN